MLALNKAAKTTAIVIESGEATSCPIVFATATPKTNPRAATGSDLVVVLTYLLY